MKFIKYNKIYLDYASATPIDKGVVKNMNLLNKKVFANAGAIYKDGVNSSHIIEESRSKIAKLMYAHPDEIIFTGSGTESIALALLGVVKNYESRIRNEKLEYKIPHIITSNIEHKAVLENCKLLKNEGRAEVTYIKVDQNGLVNPKDIKEALKENTILVSIMYANNEIGTIEPIQEIGKVIRHFKKERQGEKNKNDFVFPVLHTDACQAMNYLPTENIEKLGVDMLSFNSSKIYGPKGIGVLYKKRSIKLSPIYGGGGQEYDLRSGTENTVAIMAVAEAFEKVSKIKNKEVDRLTKLRDYAIEKLLAINLFKIILNGDSVKRLPNNINISILGISSELVVVELGARGIMVSEKSACGSMDSSESHVIEAIRKEGEVTNGSIRITLGRYTKKQDIDTLVKILNKILLKYRQWK